MSTTHLGKEHALARYKEIAQLHGTCNILILARAERRDVYRESDQVPRAEKEPFERHDWKARLCFIKWVPRRSWLSCTWNREANAMSDDLSIQLWIV